MKENLKYLIKLSSAGLYSFLKIALLGTLSTIAAATIEFIILSDSISSANSPYASAVPVFIIFLARPAGATLWYLTCLASPFLIFIAANKYVLKKLAGRLVRDKSESFIYPILDKSLLKFKASQPELIRNAADASLARLKIIKSIKDDSGENKWLRKIIIYGIKKAKLEDVDFSRENLSYYDIIKTKTIESLKNVSAPSRSLIWIILGIQWIILLFIWLTNY